MTTDQLPEALELLHGALAEAPELAASLYGAWREGDVEGAADLEPALRAAAEIVDNELPRWTRENVAPAELKRVFTQPTSEILFIWTAANAPRNDARLHGVLAAAAKHDEYRVQAQLIARLRIIQGPLEDALMCAPLLGKGDQLALPENREARARMEILLWEAGACALQMPELGKWIWASDETFDELVGRPARGSLRGRVLAARCLEVCACGMPAMTDPRLVGRTLQVLQPLLLHPEPLVWIHAARSFGRLAGVFEPLEGTLLDWVHGASPVLRQRALTAFASLPANRLSFLGHELESILDAPGEEGWVLAAAAAATPHLFHERRDLWDPLAKRIMRGDGGAVAARALARGLATLWRRGGAREGVEEPFRRLRRMARRAGTDDVDDWRRWLETIAVTDPVDGAERDPLDIELGLENLVRLAAQYDDEEADARAARFAGTLAATFSEARRIVLGDGSLRQRAAAINAVEGCARSLALRLWGPMLATRPGGVGPLSEPQLAETWATVASAPAELLDIVDQRRLEESLVDEIASEPAPPPGDAPPPVPGPPQPPAGGSHKSAISSLPPFPDARTRSHSLRPQANSELDERFYLALEVLALKLGGYALDACGAETELGPGRGPTAHDTCLWLRKLDGLADGSRVLPPPLRSALSALFWRLVDTTRGTALGEVDDVEWLGPFAAWWALVIDRPALLQQLATALPMIADGALEKCCELADSIRSALSSGAPNGEWGPDAQAALGGLKATNTELAEALSGLATALAGFAVAAGPRADLEETCVHLVIAAERLQAALADPVRALHPASSTPDDDSLKENSATNAPRMASVVARAIRARQPALLDVWFAALGPIASALVEGAVKAAMGRTPPPPPAKKKKEPKTIVGYELIKPLGEGGIGSVWLVRKPGADRYFVLKIPKSDVLESASESEREGILSSFHEEARALAGLYHPNVANIIDRGVEGDVPYLVLEYLIGADLKQYSTARLMSLFELRSIVHETCSGLTALHNAGLVHRDIKPANLWLRLPLAGGERFDPDKHRDPATTRPLSSVIIDFGMVRAQKVAPDVGGRFVAGTPGYIAPEQVLDPVELDGRADVYALAGTIFNVTTGHTFFDEIEDARERIVAHMQRDPMENAEPFRVYPAGLIKLMRAATAKEWKDRPTPLEFGKEFEAIL